MVDAGRMVPTQETNTSPPTAVSRSNVRSRSKMIKCFKMQDIKPQKWRQSWLLSKTICQSLLPTSRPHLQKASPARITTTGRTSLHFIHFSSRLWRQGRERGTGPQIIHTLPSRLRKVSVLFLTPSWCMEEVERETVHTQTRACVLSKLPICKKTRALGDFSLLKPAQKAYKGHLSISAELAETTAVWPWRGDVEPVGGSNREADFLFE